jgi:hypothetical protein
MTFLTLDRQSFARQLLAAWRRFIHWLTSAHVILALLMFVLMVYLILVPLYRMVETTLTYQEKDLLHTGANCAF